MKRMLTGAGLRDIRIGVGSRKSERADAYKALSARYRALVDEGFIDVGMNTNAVYIAWGKPYEIMRVDFPTGERTVWVYTAATSEQVSSWQYRPTGNPYSARRGNSGVKLTRYA